MPIIDCGSAPFNPLSAQYLVDFGPTVLIEVGFNPTLIGQMATPSALGAAPTTPNVPAPSVPTVGTIAQTVPALIDTGATLSCIDDSLAQQLQLPLVNQIRNVGVHGIGTLNVYLAYITIVALGAVQVGEFVGAIMNVPGQVHRALIGRSLLKDMILVYDGKTGSVKLAC